MPIADSEHFAARHIAAQALNASEELAEQAIHCLELVAELTQVGLSFQFKGGNSLLLVLDEPLRFSVDVDIATDEPRDRLEACLDRLVGSHGVFVRWDRRQHKTKPWLPLASYYLYYRSVVTGAAEPSIMLDAQLRRSPYRTERKRICCGRLYECSAEAEVPLPASIIGDKLLTMGPFTLGIPLGKAKEAQRLKHAFDVSRLLSMHPNLDDVRESFDACLEQENTLQQKRLSGGEVMADTMRFCGSVVHHVQAPAQTDDLSPVLRENAVGLPLFAGHLFHAGYSWQRLQTDLARVAVCISAVCVPSVAPALFSEVLAQEATVPGGVGLAPGVLQENQTARRYWEQVCAWLGYNPLDT